MDYKELQALFEKVKKAIDQDVIHTEVTDSSMLVTIGKDRFWVQEQGEFFVDKDDDDVSLDEKAWAVTDTLNVFMEEEYTAERMMAKGCIIYIDRMVEEPGLDLDTPDGVKEALLSGKDLYNPQTGEFWWKYNDTGSIANTYVHLDDPNLLAVIDNPDFDLFEDIVGWLNYTGYIADSPDYYAENADDYPDAPDYDERDAVFAQIASEDGWVVATPENVRKAVQAHMAENGADAPGKENGMDKAAEIAAWKEKHVPIDRNGDDALVMHKMADGSREFIVAHGYDEETGHWGHGTYYDSLASAAADLEGRAISAPGMEVICPDFWYRDDIEFALEEAGLEVNDENVDAALEALDLDGEPILSNFHDRLAETGNEMIADAVNNIGPNGGGGGAPEAFVDRGISLKAVAESMRRASQALSANGGTDAPDGKDECQPSFTPDLS